MILFTGYAPVRIFSWLIQTAQGFPKNSRAEFVGLRLGEARLTVYPDECHQVAYNVVVRNESTRRAVLLEGYSRADLLSHLVSDPPLLELGLGLDIPPIYACPIMIMDFRLWPRREYDWDQPLSVLVKSFSNGHLRVI